jgi:uncharacterized cupredoxin-like copper-binding protein
MEEKKASNLAPALAAVAMLAMSNQSALAKSIVVDDYGRVLSAAGEIYVVTGDTGSLDDNGCCNNVNCQCGSNKDC